MKKCANQCSGFLLELIPTTDRTIQMCEMPWKGFIKVLCLCGDWAINHVLVHCIKQIHSQTSINLQIFTGTVSFSYLWSNRALGQDWLIPAMSKPFTQIIKLMYCEKRDLNPFLWDTEMTLESCHCHSWCDLGLKVYSKINPTKQSFWREIKCELGFGSCAVHFPYMG